MNEVLISKGKLITDILQDEAVKFYKSTDPDILAIRAMMQDASEIDLASPVVQAMMQLAVTRAGLSSSVMDRVTAMVSTNSGTSKTYSVAAPQGVNDIKVWASNYIEPAGAKFVVWKDGAFIKVTTVGSFTAPGATQI